MGVGHTKTLHRFKNTQESAIKTNHNRDVDKTSYFFELDTAIVIRVIDSIDDPEITKTGNLSLIGSVLCKPIHSMTNRGDDDAILAYPMSPSVKQFPVVNEMVVVGEFGTSPVPFYWPLNYFNNINYNGNRNLNTRDGIGIGKSNDNTSNSFLPSIGSRQLIPSSGDTIIQSRFGSAIRFTDSSANDDNISSYSPSILITNDIRGTTTKNSIVISEENINRDGSSIYLTSGPANVNLQPTVYYDKAKKVLIDGNGYEKFTTVKGGTTSSFIYPRELDGNQVLISSDRLVFTSNIHETLFFSKGQFGIFSDSKFSVDSNLGIDLSTPNSSFRLKSNNTYINSSDIYLGKENNIDQPALLGTNTLIHLDGFFKDLRDFMKILSSLFDSAERGGQLNIPGLVDMVNAFSENVNKQYVLTEDIKQALLSNTVFIGPNK